MMESGAQSHGAAAGIGATEQGAAVPRRGVQPRRVSARPAFAARSLDPPADLIMAVEGLLFVAEGVVTAVALARALRASPPAVEGALNALAERCAERGIRLQRDRDGVRLISAPELGPYVERFLGEAAEEPLSIAALETLAIIAYRQPVARGGIEAIRGVNSERTLSTLRARDLVEEVGRAETPGHPVLFGTTARFLQHFGLHQLDELPSLPEDADANAVKPAGSAETYA
jgi:segregation and condensation protein B